MVERWQDGPGDQAHLACALRGGSQEDEGAGAIATIGSKVMFDDLDGSEAEVVGKFTQIERFAKINVGRFAFRTARREKVQAAFHASLPMLSLSLTPPQARRVSRSPVTHSPLAHTVLSPRHTPPPAHSCAP